MKLITEERENTLYLLLGPDARHTTLYKTQNQQKINSIGSGNTRYNTPTFDSLIITSNLKLTVTSRKPLVNVFN